MSFVSTASDFNVWKNQSFGVTSNKSTVPQKDMLQAIRLFRGDSQIGGDVEKR
uniref:Uncharacterized protein n=1 Tax=Candidatus Methanogaster sp. ANME-2c ERB4 TaxID=2759911 RepID=A0A7G9YL89_9EURY|nr:hypothetical protein BEOMFINI_00012 [Methanosarcinales archaeon ANME-2c ERB4]